MVCNRHCFAQSLHLPSIPALSWCLMPQPATMLPLGWTGVLYHYWCHWLSSVHFSFEFLCFFSACMNYSPRNRRGLQGIKGWAPVWCGGVTPNLLLALGLHLSSMKAPHKVIIGLRAHGLGASTGGLKLLLCFCFQPQINKQPQMSYS